jgi:1,4-dihydroxy-2-naphthoate octaprenyltransferase
VKLSYRGMGEAAIFVAFGPLATMGAYFVQAGRITGAAFWCGVPAGLLVMLILVVNEFPDWEADAAAGKRTIVVAMGRRRALIFTAAAYAAAYAAAVGLVGRGMAPTGALGVLATAPVAVFAVARIRRYAEEPPRLVAASAAGVLTHLAFCAILAAAYVASRR